MTEICDVCFPFFVAAVLTNMPEGSASVNVYLHRCPNQSLWSHMPITFTVSVFRLEIWSRMICVNAAEKSGDGRKRDREGQQQPKVRKGGEEERYFDWQLSGLVPAEVVPPADCYYQQKDFPIALAGTVSPLSPGGCYPIWVEMNRGPLKPYEVCVDRIFTEGARWSKQAICQH